MGAYDMTQEHNSGADSDRYQELRERRQQASLGGGKARIEAQHAKGKRTARERLALLLDEGTFQEIGPYVASRQPDQHPYPGDAVVTGYGLIDGRRVCVYAQDFTVFGGSFSEAQAMKVCQVMDLALQGGLPVIGLNDSVGARIQEGVYSLAGYAELFWRNTQASGVVPQISVMLGPCAGGSVYSPGLTDFVIMTRQISHMFITGPDVIRTVTGEEVDLETLGGADTHNRISGVAHFAAADEAEAVELTRRLLSYLPSNNVENPPYVPPNDDPGRMDPALDTLIPEDPTVPYDMNQVFQGVFDRGSFFEAHAAFAPNAITGFARLDGAVVGVVAQQPLHLAGVIDIDASDKICRFIRFCDCFNIPLITFVDSPGFLPGIGQEHGGIIRHGAKIVYAYSEATVPKISIVTRKAYGGAYIVMSSKYIRTDLCLAWPMAEIAVMGADGAVAILHRRELKTAGDPEALHAQLVAEFQEKFGKPYLVAASGHVDDVIKPSETRPRLVAALHMLKDKAARGPAKKHGNMPV
jgi:acetyl-CoA carboxylase carboxyltransferase component